MTCCYDYLVFQNAINLIYNLISYFIHKIVYVLLAGYD